MGTANVGDATVLFVNADSRLQQELSSDADHRSFSAVFEPTASAGLDRLAATDIDCVVSGFELPDTNGVDLLEATRERDPDLPFILFPTSGSEAVASRAVSQDVTEYLPKETLDEPYRELVDRVTDTVSQRRDDREAFRAQEQFEKLIRSSSDVVFVVNAEGTYKYVSPPVESVLGYEPAELVGENGFDYVHPEDREETMGEFFRAIENPEHEPAVEFRAEHKDGSWVWLAVRGRNLLDDPDVGGFVVNARDVTEDKEYRRQIAEREQRLRRIAEHLPETVIWMTDPSYTEVYYVSPGYEDLWGRPVEQLYENPAAFIEGVHPDDRERVLAGMDDMRPDDDGNTDRESDRIEYRVVSPDGTVSWVRGATVGLRDDAGNLRRWIGIATDITARKQRERELEGYETLHRTVPDGVFLLDAEGTMHHVNRAWARMTGKPQAELEGASYRMLIEEDIMDESASEQYSELLRELLSSETDRDWGTIVIRTTLPGQSSEHVYEAHVGLLPYDEEYRGSAVVVRDVTALQRQYEE